MSPSHTQSSTKTAPDYPKVVCGRWCSLLIRIGQSHRPLDPTPRIIDLSCCGELEFGRASEESVPGQPAQQDRVDLDDNWASTRHARLTRGDWVGTPPAFTLEDTDSKNGSFIRGQRIQRQTLQSGDIIEIGHTAFKFHQELVEDLDALLGHAYQEGDDDLLSSVNLPVLAATRIVRQLAPTQIPLLITGESGTGKGVFTEAIHRLSGRSGRLVAINCSAIPDGIVESELFGHSRGAFTGAVSQTNGLVEEARGGTLLLDEVGDMPLAMQAKVLRLLQDQSYSQVGDPRQRVADLRIVAATNQDLNVMMDQGRFRGDLLARLRGVQIRLPPLRERLEDLGLLLSRFLARFAPGRQVTLSPPDFRALLLHPWPFNIRELERLVEATVALNPGGALRFSSNLAAALDEGPTTRPKPALKGVEEAILRETLEGSLSQNKGNLSAVARDLGHDRKQIRRWLQRLGLEADAYRPVKDG